MNEKNEKICPKCKETIKAEAEVCRFCGEKFGMELHAQSWGVIINFIITLAFLMFLLSTFPGILTVFN